MNKKGKKLEKLKGAIELFNMQLNDLLDDDSTQIIISKNLFNAFNNSSKCKKIMMKRHLYRYLSMLYFYTTIQLSILKNTGH